MSVVHAYPVARETKRLHRWAMWRVTVNEGIIDCIKDGGCIREAYPPSDTHSLDLVSAADTLTFPFVTAEQMDVARSMNLREKYGTTQGLSEDSYFIFGLPRIRTNQDVPEVTYTGSCSVYGSFSDFGAVLEHGYNNNNNRNSNDLLATMTTTTTNYSGSRAIEARGEDTYRERENSQDMYREREISRGRQDMYSGREGSREKPDMYSGRERHFTTSAARSNVMGHEGDVLRRDERMSTGRFSAYPNDSSSSRYSPDYERGGSSRYNSKFTQTDHVHNYPDYPLEGLTTPANYVSNRGQKTTSGGRLSNRLHNSADFSSDCHYPEYTHNSSAYHFDRFRGPLNCSMDSLNQIAGSTFNVAKIIERFDRLTSESSTTLNNNNNVRDVATETLYSSSRGQQHRNSAALLSPREVNERYSNASRSPFYGEREQAQFFKDSQVRTRDITTQTENDGAEPGDRFASRSETRNGYPLKIETSVERSPVRTASYPRDDMYPPFSPDRESRHSAHSRIQSYNSSAPTSPNPRNLPLLNLQSQNRQCLSPPPVSPKPREFSPFQEYVRRDYYPLNVSQSNSPLEGGNGGEGGSSPGYGNNNRPTTIFSDEEAERMKRQAYYDWATPTQEKARPLFPSHNPYNY